MSPLPLPVRVAAGLVAIALERARKLPQDVSEWPMAAVGQALQASMRVQQRLTELAIKGDEALAGLREPQEDPPWAVFDEDLPEPTYLRPRTAEPETAMSEAAERAGYGVDRDVDPADFTAADLAGTAFTAEEQSWLDAIDEVHGEPTGDAVTTTAVDAGPAADAEAPAALPNYSRLSLASVRGRLRTLSLADLEDLLAYERSHDDRPEFVRMLTNRIATVRDQ